MPIENLQSPPRYIANTEFHITNEKFLRRLNKHDVRGVILPVGFPMDMNRWPNKKIRDVSHRLVAVFIFTLSGSDR